MADLIAWLDAQERKPFSRVAPIDETVEAFDPLNRARWYGEGFGVPARIEEIYDRGQIGQQGRGAGFRRTRTWRFAHDLAKSLVPQMMNKIKYNVQTRHKINYRTAYQLRNSQTGETMTYYTNTNSPWFPKLSNTKEWLKTKEELRLQGEKIDRPDTKWVFEKHLFIDLKVVLDRQPLQIGLGRLGLIGSETNEKSSLLTITMTIFVYSGVLLFIEENINGIIAEEQVYASGVM